MNNVNPTLASATQALYTQANGLTDVLAKEPKVTDKTTAETSSANNTTVTLSDQSKAQAVDYRDLVKSQTVNDMQSVEDAPVDANQATNNLSSASDLQLRANYMASQNDIPV
ncbi:hypothetical protein AVO42_02260 [Thiomicrospira sp. XS5]|uniref:hypothetical protein n=1 Tax=Thiomicrospira sp. XS5 TaxID=1775636 RepID=UPI0007483DAE|nr:hypothetical protein [Thiomicrospira sp. XS5]KUJ74261.1 hypothetical protein AVO42_02260 [Thiomicrospira sp. XS5]